jgi:hypothetical protein
MFAGAYSQQNEVKDGGPAKSLMRYMQDHRKIWG